MSTAVTRTPTTCLALLLVLYAQGVVRAASPSQGQSQSEPPELPEPPPAPLQEPPEPPPAPLVVPDDEAATTSRRLLGPTPAQRSARIYTAVGWTGAGVTLAFITAGTVLGVLAQNRSDALSRYTTLRDGDNRPPLFDEEHRATYRNLQSEGQTFERATIGCFLSAGVAALATGVLFWDASKLQGKEKKLVLAPTLAVTPGGGLLSLSGRY